MRHLLNFIAERSHSITALAAVIVLAQILLIALPLSGKIRNVNAKIEAANKNQTAAQQTLVTLKQLQSAQASGAADFSRLKLALPSNPELQDIYITLDSIASRTAVSILSVTPNPASANAIPVVLAIKGSYESMVEFMDALNRNIRPIDIASVGFATGVENNNIILTGSMKLNFFIVPSQTKLTQ